MDSLALTLTPEFAAHNFDREQFVAYVERWLQRVDVRWLERQRITVEQTGDDEFIIFVGYRAGIANRYSGTFMSRWRIAFISTPHGWRIMHIDPEPTPVFPVQDWNALDRL